ncbi:hypothetical protein KVA01_22570 [Kocuria varians]|uniref:Uncharacterized protein n=1 Tax=Kocuria varians TaxID=1272 RepID=A0A4Y4D701_KOCVA|nr:hypothetical protein KVA01_22570 [Kocuria varians]
MRTFMGASYLRTVLAWGTSTGVKRRSGSVRPTPSPATVTRARRGGSAVVVARHRATGRYVRGVISSSTTHLWFFMVMPSAW